MIYGGKEKINIFKINFPIRKCLNLILKTKRVQNPLKNRWRNDGTSAGVIKISLDGLKAVSNSSADERQYVYAEQGFPISVQHCRSDHFPGTILYYFEVKVVKTPFNW
jgi:hypothetical protein